MNIQWGQFATPEFVVGTGLSGLLLNVVATYITRGLDRARARWSAEERDKLEQLLARRSKYAAFAKADSAGYAALAAEASRLRARSVRRFLSMLAIAGVLIFIWAFGELKPGWRGWFGTIAVLGMCLAALSAWVLTLADDRSARTLEAALHEVRKDKGIPLES